MEWIYNGCIMDFIKLVPTHLLSKAEGMSKVMAFEYIFPHPQQPGINDSGI